MGRKRALPLISALSVVVASCGDDPAAPSLAPTPSTSAQASPCPPACPTTLFELTGTATDDDGLPVAGARITVHPGLSGQATAAVSTTTDGAGLYRLTFEASRDAVGGVGSAVADLPGHETVNRYLVPRGSSPFVQNFHLYRIRRIMAGGSVSLLVRPDDSACGINFEWVCGAVRVTAPGAGTVGLTLVSEDASHVTGLETFQQHAPGTYRCCATQISTEAEAGAEIVAMVLLEWTARESQAFTLHTSFEPQ